MVENFPKPIHLEDWLHYRGRCRKELKDLGYPLRDYLELNYVFHPELCICESCKKSLDHPWNNKTVKVNRYPAYMVMFFLCSDCQKT